MCTITTNRIGGIGGREAPLYKSVPGIQANDAERWMAAIVESSDDAIISKNLDGIIISCNQGASRLYGYAPAELIGYPMTNLIPAVLQNEEVDILSRIRRGEPIEHFETVRQHKDGHLIPLSLTISPVKDSAGLIIGASQIARDITERKLVEQKLAESFQREKTARELAESANRAKDDFLAALSHELRTPLNPVLMLVSDQAENMELPPETRNHFQIIHKNIELEARLIDDLLDLTRISYGKLSLNPRLLDGPSVLREAVAIVQSDLNEKQIELVIKVPAGPFPVFGDEVRLLQVFWNVIKNAVKFTPIHGKITIETAVVAGKFQVTVTDTGIGITPAEMEGIFAAFSQGDHGVNRPHRFGGLGLGLTISRRLVEMHAGSIRADSAGRDQGSTFIIELPLANAEKVDREQEESRRQAIALPLAGNKRRILLVEDHEGTRAALSHLLGRRNFTVSAVGDCSAARALCARAEFDLVISDIGLPDGNGNELMKDLHDKHGLSGIALTGYGMESDVAHSLESGFVSHLTKPVNVQTLERALKTYFGAHLPPI